MSKALIDEIVKWIFLSAIFILFTHFYYTNQRDFNKACKKAKADNDKFLNRRKQ